jgi:hypothetical protein
LPRSALPLRPVVRCSRLKRSLQIPCFTTLAVGQWGVRQQGVGKSGAAICSNRGGSETVVNAPSRTSLQLKRNTHSSLPREIVMFADVLLRVQRRSSRR